MRDGEPLYFYELHEGDDEVDSDVLLAHDVEYDEDEFLSLVLEARGSVVDRFEEDTLSEAVARELARRHGFLVIDDTQLRVSVHVSAEEGETAITEVTEGRGAPEDEGEFRSMLVDVDPEDRRWSDG